MVEQIECVREKMRELILLAKNNEQYTRDSVMNIMCICCSVQMFDAGYTQYEALDKAIELIKTKSKSEVYSELLKLTKFED